MTGKGDYGEKRAKTLQVWLRRESYPGTLDLSVPLQPAVVGSLALDDFVTKIEIVGAM